MRYSPFSMDKALQSINPAGQLVKMLITLGSNFAYLYILTLSSHIMQNGDEALPSISPAGRSQLVKMRTTLVPHGMF